MKNHFFNLMRFGMRHFIYLFPGTFHFFGGNRLSNLKNVFNEPRKLAIDFNKIKDESTPIILLQFHSSSHTTGFVLLRNQRQLL